MEPSIVTGRWRLSCFRARMRSLGAVESRCFAHRLEQLTGERVALVNAVFAEAGWPDSSEGRARGVVDGEDVLRACMSEREPQAEPSTATGGG